MIVLIIIMIPAIFFCICLFYLIKDALGLNGNSERDIWLESVRDYRDIMPLSLIKHLYFVKDNNNNIELCSNNVYYEDKEYRLPNYKEFKKYRKWYEYRIQPTEIEEEQLRILFDKIYSIEEGEKNK